MIKVIVVKCKKDFTENRFNFRAGKYYLATKVQGNYSGEGLFKIYDNLKKEWYVFLGKHIPGRFKISGIPLFAYFSQTDMTYYIENKKELNKFIKSFNYSNLGGNIMSFNRQKFNLLYNIESNKMEITPTENEGCFKIQMNSDCKPCIISLVSERAMDALSNLSNTNEIIDNFKSGSELLLNIFTDNTYTSSNYLLDIDGDGAFYFASADNSLLYLYFTGELPKGMGYMVKKKIIENMNGIFKTNNKNTHTSKTLDAGDIDIAYGGSDFIKNFKAIVALSPTYSTDSSTVENISDAEVYKGIMEMALDHIINSTPTSRFNSVSGETKRDKALALVIEERKFR